MKRLSTFLNRVVFWLLVVIITLAPIPFGAIFPWSYTLLAVIVAGLLLLWVGALVMSGAPPPVPFRYVRVPALLFGAVIVWCLVQVSPGVPESWHNPVWAQTAAALGTEVQGYISVDPYATKTTVMRLLTYASVFWLALQYGRDPLRAKQVFFAVAIAGLVYAGYGLLKHFSGSDTILWYEKERYTGSVTSTFRYKNAYATYAGMGLISALALIVSLLRQAGGVGIGRKEALIQMFVFLSGRNWILVLALVVITSALLLSNSRAGVTACLIGVFIFTIALLAAAHESVTFGRTLLVPLAIIAIGLIYTSGGTIWDRFANTTGDDQRGDIYSTTLRAISDRPILGWGAASFEGTFSKYQSKEYGVIPLYGTRPLRAHNEYLESALGIGVPATTAMVGSLTWIMALCVIGLRQRRRRTHYPAAGLAIGILVGFHAAVDFTLQVPAVAVVFSIILGTACGQSRRTENAD